MSYNRNSRLKSRNGRAKKRPVAKVSEDKLASRKFDDGVPQQVTLRILKPVVLDCPYWDFNFSNATSTTVFNFNPLDGLLANNGILQAYPQHAEGQFANGTLRLRQRIRLERCELRTQFIGAVSNALLAADLYNTFRFVMYVSKSEYSNTASVYLNSTMGGTSTIDVAAVYVDKTVSLPSQAYDTTITTATPQVINWEVSFNPGLTLTCFSTTATGSGVAWDTEEKNVCMSLVSDSSVAPHPFMAGTVRFFFTYLNLPR